MPFVDDAPRVADLPAGFTMQPALPGHFRL